MHRRHAIARQHGLFAGKTGQQLQPARQSIQQGIRHRLQPVAQPQLLTQQRIQHLRQPLRLVISDVVGRAGWQPVLAAGQIHRMHHVKYKGQIQYRFATARQP
ncbi:hypothetical protein D3C75_1092280 [compost metagenome]